ncbi:V-type ATP synthase subunit F [Thermospira aquatica]|uniref:V-type ATP synthase subunit F n=1 Tax=Thermospira aquatica TaxID=2828656 RepID=A0AAX3BCU6_9SPIR|nr:V-type ATP synthase subunit F [Thermospira aquatica]URA10124.1 V-type ATP synthase subunit F [Thermospira aquatica]
MKAEVVVLGHREFVQALALGGLRGWEVSSAEEIQREWKQLLRRQGIALVIIPLWIEKILEQEILSQKISRQPPLVLSLPDPFSGEAGEVITTISEYIRTSLGVKI